MIISSCQQKKVKIRFILSFLPATPPRFLDFCEWFRVRVRVPFLDFLQEKEIRGHVILDL